MKIIAVDDERLALDNLVTQLKNVAPYAEVHAFIKPSKALEYLSEQPADIIVLDIQMPNLNGISLAKKCKEACPQINIIFATGYSEYALEAFHLHASGYLLKPIRAEDLNHEIENLRNPSPPVYGKLRIRVQTFGNFEIFVDEQPIKWIRSKCKECMAYLIDRKGSAATTAEISSILWEDKPYDRTLQNNTQKILSDMMKSLKQEHIQDIVIKQRNSIAVDPSKVDCDYYHFLEMEAAAINSYCGEYMTNYSWAELTLGALEKKQLK